MGVHYVSRALWKSVAISGDKRNENLPRIVGLLEAFLYPTALLAGFPEFIGVWLVLKVAGSWSGWQDPEKGRALFQVFLVGTALSLAYGAAAGVGMQLVAKCEYLFPALLAGGVLVLHGTIYWWASRLANVAGTGIITKS
jgi:hypothetical protein